MGDLTSFKGDCAEDCEDVTNVELEARIEEKILKNNEGCSSGRLSNEKRLLVCGVSIFIVGVISLIGVGIHDFVRNNETSIVTTSPSQAPSMQYEIYLNNALREIAGGNLAFRQGTSQWQARMWMIQKDPLHMPTLKEETLAIVQRYVLLTIYFAFGGGSSQGIDWLYADECESKLVRCDDDGVLRALALGECYSNLRDFSSNSSYMCEISSCHMLTLTSSSRRQ